MRLKAKGGNEAVIEKFSAQSCKTSKYAKSVVKKREPSEMKPNTASDIGTIGQSTGDTAQKPAESSAPAEKSGTAQSSNVN